MAKDCANLNVVNFGVALGCTWAIGILILGWIGWLSGWGILMIRVMGSVYLGFHATFWGTIIGAVWAFVDGFIAGIILAAIYNSCTCSKKCETQGESTSRVM